MNWRELEWHLQILSFVLTGLNSEPPLQLLLSAKLSFPDAYYGPAVLIVYNILYKALGNHVLP